MNTEIVRNLGEQQIAGIMARHGLTARDLVAGSREQLTYKMVSRACKGRRLTRNVQAKVLDALNRCAGREYALDELFTY